MSKIKRLKLSEVLSDPYKYNRILATGVLFSNYPAEIMLESGWDTLKTYTSSYSALEVIGEYYGGSGGPARLDDLGHGTLFDIEEIAIKVKKGLSYTQAEKLLYDLANAEEYQEYYDDIWEGNLRYLDEYITEEELEILTDELINRFEQETGYPVEYNAKRKEWFIKIQGFYAANADRLAQKLIELAQKYPRTFNSYSYIVALDILESYDINDLDIDYNYYEPWMEIGVIPNLEETTYSIENDIDDIQEFLLEYEDYYYDEE